MHDRAVVIDPDIVSVRYMLAKVTLATRYDLCPVDSYKGITVFAALLVPEAHGMTDLMDGITGRTAGAKFNKLIAANTTYMRPATATWPEVHIVRVHRLIRSGAQDKTNPCIGLPVRYRIGYTGLIVKCAIDSIGNNAVGPSATGQNHHTCCDLPAYLGTTKLCASLDFFNST